MAKPSPEQLFCAALYTLTGGKLKGPSDCHDGRSARRHATRAVKLRWYACQRLIDPETDARAWWKGPIGNAGPFQLSRRKLSFPHLSKENCYGPWNFALAAGYSHSDHHPACILLALKNRVAVGCSLAAAGSWRAKRFIEKPRLPPLAA